jgi:hypothetical protein
LYNATKSLVSRKQARDCPGQDCRCPSSTSESKSWISLAKALEEMTTDMYAIDYVPCYRSLGGTGTANGFYWWNIHQ